jgi:hypothetical protein
VYTRAAGLAEIFSVVSELFCASADNLCLSWLLLLLAAGRRSVLLPSDVHSVGDVIESRQVITDYQLLPVF